MVSQKTEKFLRTLWYAIAFGLTLYIGIDMFREGNEPGYNIIIFMVTAMLGYICVSVLVNRSPVLSNITGMSANVGEIYTQILYGNIGMACSSLYYFATHVLGLALWTKKENQDEEGKVKISRTNITALFFTVLFCIAGVVLMYFYGEFLMKREFGLTLFIFNIVAFVIGVSAQFTMIMRQPFSWILWSVSNLVWLVLNLMSHNYIFAVQSVLYEINALVGIYKWYQDSNKK